MDIKGKRFLLIGGAGLIGSHAADELLKEDIAELIIYDNFCRGSEENLSQALRDPRCKIFSAGGDIRQTDILNVALQGIDGVFHFAALWLLQCYEYPRSAFEVNIKGMFNVLEACYKNKVRRLVYSSSASVYGDALEEPMTEDHPYNNTNFYGATKIADEHMARAFWHRYQLPSVGLRYMNVYGPRQDYQGTYIAVIMKILDRLEKGLSPIVYGDGSQAYDFIYVVDCAQANIRAMQADTVDSCYNVGTGRKTTIKELTQVLLELTGSRASIQYEPAGKTFVKNRVGCAKKAEQEIGFVAQTDLREGLNKLIQWRNSHKAAVAKRREKVKA